MLHLDYRDARPIYVQIMDGLRQQITSGVLRQGDKLPSVRELAVELSINPNTIQRSYRQLEMEGWIATVPGKGCFVCAIPPVTPNRSCTCSGNLMKPQKSCFPWATPGRSCKPGWNRRKTMLEMKNVTKTFRDFRALDDLSLRVPKGAVYGLVGPNGAGKTTVIRHLTGIYQPDSGTIALDGQPVWNDPTVKERIGYIPDEVFYFPTATLEDMHRFYRQMYEQFDEGLYERLKDIFRLPASPIRRFSKGMQKQAAFHLTLATRPEVMILDEPVDGLDPVMRRQVMSLILSEVAERDTTVLISSHNLRELEDVCDHVGIMDHGKMLMEKSLADMQGNTVKLQIVGDAPGGFEILHESRSGRLNTFILRGTCQEVQARAQAINPAYFDVLPLSLEEIFIYELGGVNDEIKTSVL